MAVRIVPAGVTTGASGWPLGASLAVAHVLVRIVRAIALLVAVLGGLALWAMADGASAVHTGSANSLATVSPATTLLVLLFSGLIALFMTIMARRLARRRHGLVLYLRKFGYVDGTAAVTSAAVCSLGRSWRLVTLDDRNTQPISVSQRARSMSSGLKSVGTVGDALIRVPTSLSHAVFLVSSWGTALVLAHSYYQRRDVGYLVDLVKNAKAHGDEGALVSVGVKSALVSGAAFTALILLRALAQFVAVVPNQYLLAVSRTSELIQSAQERGVSQRSEIQPLVARITRNSHTGLSARLWVVKVSSNIWQDVVAAFAVSSERILIDVSQPSDNVMWEIEHLTPDLAARCVFVGRHERVSWLAEAAPGRQVNDADRRLRDALGSRTVLTYADGLSPELFARDLAAALRRPT